MEQREVKLPVALQLLSGLVAEALAAREAEAVERLVRKVVAVGHEENARLCDAKVRPLPLRRHQLVDELIRDECLACASRKRQQHASFTHAELADNRLDRTRLIVANALAARPRPRHRGAGDLKHRPRRLGVLRHERRRRRKLRHREGARLLRGKVDFKNLYSVCRVCKPESKRFCVEPRLRLAGIVVRRVLLGLDHRDALVPEIENIVGKLRIVVLGIRADAPWRDGKLRHPRSGTTAPPRRHQRRVDEKSSRLRLIHCSNASARIAFLKFSAAACPRIAAAFNFSHRSFAASSFATMARWASRVGMESIKSETFCNDKFDCAVVFCIGTYCSLTLQLHNEYLRNLTSKDFSFDVLIIASA